MSFCDLFDLVRGALPKSADIAELKQIGDAKLWETEPDTALAHALRGWELLDWQAYVAKYPDVARAESDPVWHFLKHGIFEGRRLFVKPCPEAGDAAAVVPEISVIMPNYNNGLYLEKSVGSLINQTFPDLEIIVVDDCSTDNSLEILHHLAKKDARIKIIPCATPQSQHMVRKIGVAASRGNYVMFLDSDDFYVPNACAIARGAIVKGYDIVAFNTRLLSPPNADMDAESRFAKYFNRGGAAEYCDEEILEAIYVKKQFPDLLSDKIYNGALCRKSFASMEDGYWPRGPDIYEALVLSVNARRVAKIQDCLYVYRTRVGISTPDESDSKIRQYALAGELLGPIRRFLEATGHTELYDQLMAENRGKPLNAWLNELPPRHVTAYFDTMCGQYGIVNFLCALRAEGQNAWLKTAEKFKYYALGEPVAQPPRVIGILYSVLGNGGAERVVTQLAKLLVAQGYKVVCFLEEPHENDDELPAEVPLVYLGKLANSHDALRAHLLALRKGVDQHPVDVMLCHAFYNREMLWQLMLLRQARIPVIVFPHGSFFSRLLLPSDNFTLESRVALLACADKVSVLSVSDELFYRMFGVDAQYIANPVRLPNLGWSSDVPFAKRNKNIIVFSRLGDKVKNVDACLLVLREVKNTIPDAGMTFVGSFVNNQGRPEFFNLAKSLGLSDSIRVTGWVQDARPFIDQAAVLLSTAYHEAFPLTISEAQGRGVPCVMNDLPIMAAEDNPAIIRVKHGDYKGAARAIVRLLRDQAHWQSLSAIAASQARKFSAKNYLAGIVDLLNNFTKSSPYAPYSPENYRCVLKTLAFYGAHFPPWYKKKGQ